MATRPKAVIESRDGEEFSPITIAKNVLTDDGQNLHDILSDRKEDMMTPTIENSSSMFKVGQGDNVDYSENVVDGAYESCVLKGVTKFIDNNTGETLDSFVENRDLSLIDCKSPILSNVGKNLFDYNSLILSTGNINENTGNNASATHLARTDNYVFIPKGTFTISNTPYGDHYLEKVIVYDLNKNYIGFEKLDIGTLSKQIVVEDDSLIRLTFRDDKGSATGSSPVDSVQYMNIQLEESPTATTYEPYKSNILSANGDKIELTEDMFEQGGVYFTKGQSFADATNNTASDRIRLKTLLNLKPNTTYRVTIDDAHKVGVQLYNNEKLAVSDSGWMSDATFTTKGGENAIALVIRKLSSTANISVSDFKNIKLQLSEVDKTIVLRSLLNGVCDTLNVETGEYVQRIGEFVLNGSEEWKLSGTSVQGYSAFWTRDLFYTKNELCLCNALHSLAFPNWSSGTAKDFITYNTSLNDVCIRLSASKIQSNTVDSFKKWLSENPVTVQYELATPIVTTIDAQGFPYAYTNGHVQLSSGSIEQSLTPKVEYSVATNRTGQIRSNQKMVERHQKQLDYLQAMILTNLVNTQYEQTLTNLKYDLKNVREEVK